jgi:hypothetical protein
LSEVKNSFITITCDGPACDKTVTFAETQEGFNEALQSNTWMNCIRVIGTPDQRKFVYCSDECEVKATATGVHNKKLLVTPQGPNAAQLAAEAALRAQQATQALKSGGPVTLS